MANPHKPAFISDGILIDGYIAETSRTPALSFRFKPVSIRERTRIVSAIIEEKDPIKQEGIIAEWLANLIQSWEHSEVAITKSSILQLPPYHFERLRDIVIYSGDIDEPPTELDPVIQHSVETGRLNSDDVTEDRIKN